jgi:hypothetical protein
VLLPLPLGRDEAARQDLEAQGAHKVGCALLWVDPRGRR